MPNGNGNGARLDSWKEIASYLQRDVRTAIRWEKEKGLPVRRVPGGKRQAVFAYPGELDSWLRREDPGGASEAPQGLKPDSGKLESCTTEVVPFLTEGIRAVANIETSRGLLVEDVPKEAPHRRAEAFSSAKAEPPFLQRAKPIWAFMLSIGIIVLTLVGILVTAHLLRARPEQARPPVRLSFTLNALQVFDSNNQTLWTHTFSGVLEPSVMSEVLPLSDFSFVGDFRGKGDTEVLVVAPLRVGLTPTDDIKMEVDLFSSSGKLLWSYSPQERFQFGKQEITGPWCPGPLLVTSHEGNKQIWAIALHPVWGNSFVVNLDPATGEDTLRFVNTGVIRSLSEVRMERRYFLLIGGFNNEPDTGSLAVVDEAKPFAASPQGAGTRHKCVSCVAGDPDFYFVFPRSEINELEQFHEAGVIEVRAKGNRIQVRKKELGNGGPQTIYELEASEGVRPISIRFDSSYDMLHRKLEAEGTLNHTLEDCSERLHPRPIRKWTPSEGWTKVYLDPSGG